MTPSGVAAGEEPHDGAFWFTTDEDGSIADWRQARRESLRFINTAEDADFSTLLRKPMPTAY